MATTVNRIPETVIVPRSCRERFLPVNAPAMTALREFGVESAGISTLRPPYRIGRTPASMNVVIWTTAGLGRVRTESGESDLAPGRLWFAPAGSRYMYWAPRAWSCVWFHFSAAPKRESGSGFRDASSSAGPQLWKLVESALDESARDEVLVTRALRAYAELIAITLERELPGGGRDAAYTATRRTLNALWERVDADLSHPWTIAELAKIMALSPVHFHRTVVALCNVTPMAMVTRLRMRRTEAMLRDPAYKLSTIADAVGYETPFALSRAFKRYAGRSPRR